MIMEGVVTGFSSTIRFGTTSHLDQQVERPKTNEGWQANKWRSKNKIVKQPSAGGATKNQCRVTSKQIVKQPRNYPGKNGRASKQIEKGIKTNVGWQANKLRSKGNMVERPTKMVEWLKNNVTSKQLVINSIGLSHLYPHGELVLVVKQGWNMQNAALLCDLTPA